MTNDDDAPATSRSEEISARSIREPGTVRERVTDLVISLQGLVEEVRRDPDAGVSAKVACMRAMTGPLRLLATLTGEAGASETAVLSSPIVQRLLADILEALRPFPDAMRAVHARIAPTAPAPRRTEAA